MCLRRKHIHSYQSSIKFEIYIYVHKVYFLDYAN